MTKDLTSGGQMWLQNQAYTQACDNRTGDIAESELIVWVPLPQAINRQADSGPVFQTGFLRSSIATTASFSPVSSFRLPARGCRPLRKLGSC